MSRRLLPGRISLGTVMRRTKAYLKPAEALRLATIAVAVGVAAVFMLRPATASAHAVLIRSDPPAGATLQEAPKQIQLWFSEGLSRELTTIRLLDAKGKDVGPLGLIYNDADDRQVSASVPDLQRGTYTVAWSSFSSDDGHRLDGSIPFGVGVAPTGAAATSSPDYRPSAREVAARWFSLIGALGLGGAVTIAFLMGRPPARDQDPRRLLMMLALVAIGMLAAGDAAVLLLRAQRAGGFGEAGNVLTGSTWGRLWIARMWLAVFGAGAVAAMLVSLRAWFHARLAALGLIATCVLLTESLSSHAATRAADLPVVADFAHLAASAAWIGTVLALPALVFWSRRDPSGARRALTAGAAKRFAFVAAASFGVILLTGIYRTVEEMPTLRSFVDTTYGKALTVKLALVVAVLLFGAANFLLARRWDAMRSRRLWTIFSRTIPGEALIGVAIVAAVALMTLATPAASLTRGATPDPTTLTGVVESQQAAGDLIVDLSVEPTGSASQRVKATISRNGNASSADRPLVVGQGLDITQVRFSFRPLDQPVGESKVIANQTASGDQYVFETDGAFLPFKGKWQIQTDIRRKSEDDVSARFVVDTEKDQGPAYTQVLPSDKLYYTVTRSSGNPQLVLAAGDGFYYRSTDGGVTWTQVQGSGAYHLVADPTNPNGFIAAGGGLVRTTDAGDSWTTLYHDQGNDVLDAVVDPADARIIVMAAAKGIYRSGDSGATWDLRLPSAPRSVDPSQADEWTRLAVGPDGTMIAGRRPGVIVVSRDGGQTWQEPPAKLDLPGGVMGLMVEPSDSRHWFVGSMGSGIWITTDSGASWQQPKSGVSPDGHGVGFDKTNGGQYVVATTGQGVFVSGDGVDWTQLGDARIEQGIAEAVGLATDADGKPALLVAGVGLYRLTLSSESTPAGQTGP